MGSKYITIINNLDVDSAEVLYEADPVALSVNFAGGSSVNNSGNNLFECFSQVRRLLPDIVFLCKGAKRNVYPSRMSSQMAGGLLAYELRLGGQALEKKIL